MPLKLYEETPKHPLKRIKRVVAVAAGKGGVGKSTVAVNLALALKELGFQVGILDADIYGPSVRKMLPENEMPIQRGETLLPALSRGIRLISMAYFRKESEAAVVRAPIANGLIRQFLDTVDWGDLDFLLIDFPPGTGDIQLTLSQHAYLAGALMVTTPQEVAMLDVRKAMHMFHQVKVPILGVVENMSYYIHTGSDEKLYLLGKGGGERLARENGVPFLGQIPIDPEISRCGDHGESLLSKDCIGAASFISLAREFIKQMQVIESEMIRSLVQKDNHTFTIEWNDGKIAEYRLSELQKQCPCARCVDELTGKRIVQESTINEDVRAKGIDKVGRYALRVEFTSGCSTGIYDFDMLRKMANRG